MTESHDRYRDWSAAFLLGALEPAERIAFEKHLKSCAICQSDVNDFASLPGLLALIDPAGEADSAAEDRVVGRAVARADHDYQRVVDISRRWRLVAVASIAAAAVLIMAFGLGSIDRTSPDGRELVIAPSAGAEGSVSIEARAWGTAIELDLVGLSPRDDYQLWAIDTAGTWTTAASWQSTPAGLARLTGAAAVATDAIEEIVITSADRNDVVLVAHP